MLLSDLIKKLQQIKRDQKADPPVLLSSSKHDLEAIESVYLHHTPMAADMFHVTIYGKKQ